MAGLERPPNHLNGPLSFRNIVSGYLRYLPRAPVAFALAVDYGNDSGVYWWGIAGYARVRLRSWLAATLRGDYLADPFGFVTRAPERVAAGTATVEVWGRAGRLSMQARLEYRRDQSSARVFDGALPASRYSQDTLTLALLATY
jgi:hypothetical protein